MKFNDSRQIRLRKETLISQRISNCFLKVKDWAQLFLNETPGGGWVSVRPKFWWLNGDPPEYRTTPNSLFKSVYMMSNKMNPFEMCHRLWPAACLTASAAPLCLHLNGRAFKSSWRNVIKKRRRPSVLRSSRVGEVRTLRRKQFCDLRHLPSFFLIWGQRSKR